MVQVPSGTYEMGDHHDGQANALPVHTVTTNAFLIDRYETTNATFRDGLSWALSQGLVVVTDGIVYGVGNKTAYCRSTSNSTWSRITWDGSTFGVIAGKEDHPMVSVSWYGAAAFANWRSAMEGLTPGYDTTTWSCNFKGNGYRLPTEAEWEKAARGGLYSPYYRYPWGDTYNGSDLNYNGSGDPFETDPIPMTTPVCYFDGDQIPSGVDRANGYGLYDTAGNAFEWCNDWYDGSYYSQSQFDNPVGPTTGSTKVVRGGGFNSDPGTNYYTAYRDNDSAPTGLTYDVGVRLVIGLDAVPTVSGGGILLMMILLLCVGSVVVAKRWGTMTARGGV